MKAFIFVLLTCYVSAKEPKVLELDYKDGTQVEYSSQIQTKFAQLIASDPALAKEFRKFEAPPPEHARGRYNGIPSIQVITISESENVDFRNSSGAKVSETAIALYYRFEEGIHRGTQTSSGFFAHFIVTGDLAYRHAGNEKFELTKSQVVAKFKGFSRTITAPKPVNETQPDRDTPAN